MEVVMLHHKGFQLAINYVSYEKIYIYNIFYVYSPLMQRQGT